MLPTVSKNDVPDLSRWNFPQHNYMGAGQANVLVALIAKVKPRVVYEFGVNEGWTARDILHIPSIKRYVGVDVLPDYKTEIKEQQREVPADPGVLVKDKRFELLRTSNGTWDMLGTEICDAVFIDGDHGYKSVMHDSILAASIVRPGGVIVWHDYKNTTVQVTEALDDLRDCGRDIRHVEDTWMAFEWR